MFNKWVDRYGLLKSEEINQTSKKQLLEKMRQALAESLELGEDLEKTKNRLQKASEEVFYELSDVRAYLIARTETGASVNMGQMATYQATGIERKEWIATLDDRTRESHLQIDGTVLPMSETFEVMNIDGGVDNMLYPSDPNGSAGNTCNCRCSLAPVIF
jgi:SPP1 gp7 family putative phage head morphogenesis protein